MAILLGVDLGTSGVKVLEVDAKGAVKASVSETYPLIQPRAGWAEQRAEDWWQVLIKAIRKIL